MLDYIKKAQDEFDALDEAGQEDIQSRIDRLAEVYAVVILERHKQDKQWGGAGHDDNNGPFDWLKYIQKQVDHARLEAVSRETTKDELRQRFIKIAALSVAAIEVIDRIEAAEIACGQE
jgi:hypothetical protein